MTVAWLRLHGGLACKKPLFYLFAKLTTLGPLVLAGAGVDNGTYFNLLYSDRVMFSCFAQKCCRTKLGTARVDDIPRRSTAGIMCL